MAEKYPPGTFVRPKSSLLKDIFSKKISDRVYEVIPQEAYYAIPKNGHPNEEEWVWIAEDDGTLNGWHPTYFYVVEITMPEPDWSLDEIERAQEAYERLK